MLKVVIGNIFESKATTLVNTVNCVGVMGKGIALEFKKQYPEMFYEYASLCETNSIKPGVPYLYTDFNGTSILNFPTKDHWRSASKLSYIVDGLKWFQNNYKRLNITSIAFPPLGCGNGGLSWEVVGPLMYEYLHCIPIYLEIYAPYGTKPEQLTEKFLSENILHTPSEILGNRQHPINKYWYLLLYVVQKLNADKHSLNVGRTIFQKLCYILTRTGIPTEFHFVEGNYGPYAKEVNTAITAFANANLLTERRLGQMIEVVVSPSFTLNKGDYTADELNCADQTVDLLSRIKRTDQAELIATVLFSFDELSAKNITPTDTDVLNHVLGWKPHWNGRKEEIISAIANLSALGWMRPTQTKNFMISDDDLY